RRTGRLTGAAAFPPVTRGGVARIGALGSGQSANQEQAMASLSERADALEHEMNMELERRVAARRPIRSPIYLSGLYDPATDRHDMGDALAAGKPFLMGPDSRIPAMPDKPT